MTTWYETRKYSNIVTPVEVARETPKQITIEVRGGGRLRNSARRAKDGEYTKYFPTELEAWEYLKTLNEGRAETARKQQKRADVNLDEIHKNIGRIKGLENIL